jgi:hypothetical protein
MVQVNVLVHVESGKDVLLDGEFGLLDPDDVVVVKLERIQDSKVIEVTVPGAGEQAIAPQIIEAVNVQLAGEKRLLPCRMIGIVFVDEVGDGLGDVPAMLSKNPGDLRFSIENNSLRPRLMVDAQARLEEVREWAMTNIVQECGRQQYGSRTLGDASLIAFQMLQCLLHQVDHAETMRQAVVIGARVGQSADAQLVNATQALNFGAVQQLQ